MARERDVIAARGRRSGAFERRSRNEPERPRFLIVCEGAKTEPNYFEEARIAYRIGTAEVEICGKECGSAPMSVVEFAERRYQERKGCYERVFCVFDRDSHESFDAALARVRARRAEGFEAIYSIPCFEFWILLHFRESRKPYVKEGNKSPCAALLDDLEADFAGYKKGATGVFNHLSGRLDEARKRASRLLADSESTGEVNPSTMAHQLVHALAELAPLAQPAAGR